jgi:hypothetical protein
LLAKIIGDRVLGAALTANLDFRHGMLLGWVGKAENTIS